MELGESIFVVTTIHIKNKEIIRKRCVGWFARFDDAFNTIKTNSGDIYEAGWYNHAIIEQITDGLYPRIINEYWFHWQNGGYKRTKKPVPENWVNFGIG